MRLETPKLSKEICGQPDQPTTNMMKSTARMEREREEMYRENKKCIFALPVTLCP